MLNVHSAERNEHFLSWKMFSNVVCCKNKYLWSKGLNAKKACSGMKVNVYQSLYNFCTNSKTKYIEKVTHSSISISCNFLSMTLQCIPLNW